MLVWSRETSTHNIACLSDSLYSLLLVYYYTLLYVLVFINFCFIDSFNDDPYIQEINNDEEYLKTFPEKMVRYNFKNCHVILFTFIGTVLSTQFIWTCKIPSDCTITGRWYIFSWRRTDYEPNWTLSDL